MKYVWCAMDVDKDDSILFGQQVRNNCMEQLQNYTRGAPSTTADAADTKDSSTATDYSRPFFIGCGFHKLATLLPPPRVQT